MTRRSLVSWLVAATLLILVFPPSRVSGAFAAGPRPAVLNGSVPAVVASGHARLVGAQPGNATISITVALALHDRSALAQFLHDLNDPNSPSYHQYLSQDAANQQFNPTADDEQKVVAWLQSAGFTVTHTYANHLMVDATGTVARAQKLFQVNIDSYKAAVHGSQVTFYAPDRNPTIDASVSDVVTAITGLDSFPRFHTGYTNGSAHNVTPYYPQDFANAYDLTPLWNAGYTGSGQQIAITLWTVPPSDSTLRSFGTTSGANVATTTNGRLRVIAVDGGTTAAASPDQGEAGLDIEYTSGVAPGAVIDYYEAPTDYYGNPTDQGLEDALNLAGTNAYVHQINSSWGGCESSSTSDPFTSTVENIFATNAATGHNYFFSSGDNGSWCDPYGTGTGMNPYPDYPASSPNVTSVGGTRFSQSISGRYPGESAWAYCTTCNSGNPEGSGGGYSQIFGRPSWQTASTLARNGERGYPDISADADPNTGAYVCYGSSSSCAQFGGTSLASPLWTGITADINQYLQSQGKPVLGFLAPDLYQLATSSPAYAPFHDEISGTNGSYNAGASWDAVTGLGSPDAWNLARDLAGISTGSNSTATPTPTNTAGPANTPTPTNTPGPANTPTPTNTPGPANTPTPTNTPIPSGSPGLVIDGSFEGSASAWTEMSGAGRQLVSTKEAHSPVQSAWLCGYNSCNDHLSQTVTLPSSVSSAVLSYWVMSDTSDTRRCSDSVAVSLRTVSNGTIVSAPRQCNANTGWVQQTANVSSYLSSRAGQQVVVYIQGTTNWVNPSDFYVDDVSLTVNGSGSPSLAPTATPTNPAPTPTNTPTNSFPTNTPTATPTNTPSSGGSVNTACPGTQAGCMQAMLTMLNNDRAPYAVGPYYERPLTLNLTLSNGSGQCVGAYGHSKYMAQVGYINHNQFPADICGSYYTAGENVGEARYGNEMTDLQMLDQMMMSEPHSWGCSGNHACNIINPNFHQVGIGIYEDSVGRTWLTEDFTN